MPPRPPSDRARAPAAERIDVELVDPLAPDDPSAPIAPLDPGAGGRTAPDADGAPVPLGVAAFAAHPRWLRAAAAHLLPPGTLLARVSVDGEERVRLPCLAPARGRSLLHPVHDHLSLADVDARPGLAHGTLLDAVDATLRAAADRVGAVPAWRARAVPEGSALVRAVRDRAGASEGPVDAAGWSLRPARETARFELGRAAAAPVPGKLRRNLRRLRGRLESAAGTGAEPLLDGPDDPDALAAAFERFVALEASGWKSGDAGTGGTGTAIAQDPAILAFYRALLDPHASDRDPGLEPAIVELRVDGRTVAAKLALRTGPALHLLKIAYDESLSECAPGSLLLESLLERAPQVGIERVSLVTSPAWAARWHPRVTPTWHVTRYAPTAGGRLALVADRARELARRHHRRLRRTGGGR